MVDHPIVVVPYDPAWPHRFEPERAALASIFPPPLASIEHIGSTAVPGLGAKSVIDIMLGVGELSLVDERITKIEDLGYEYVPEYEEKLPGRRYFRKPRVRPRSHHLHAVPRGGEFWSRHLRFRDILRGNPDVAREYFALKRRLARRHGDDRIAYTEAKSQFIDGCLERGDVQGDDAV